MGHYFTASLIIESHASPSCSELKPSQSLIVCKGFFIYQLVKCPAMPYSSYPCKTSLHLVSCFLPYSGFCLRGLSCKVLLPLILLTSSSVPLLYISGLFSRSILPQSSFVILLPHSAVLDSYSIHSSVPLWARLLLQCSSLPFILSTPVCSYPSWQ